MKKAKKKSVSYKSLRTEFLLHFYLNMKVIQSHYYHHQT